MNRLWRFGNRLSRRNGILRKVARVVELVNHVICSCSVSIDAEIGERTVFFIGELDVSYIQMLKLVLTEKFSRCDTWKQMV